MTPAFTARKRAEEFNSLVEGTSTSELTSARYVDVLELVEAMRYVAPVQARPAFVADLRERLMVAAEVALQPAADAGVTARLTVAPHRSPRERRLAVAIGGFAIVGATTSMALAAQSALPGETLYPLKRALENAHAGVQVDETDKGATLLANASGRLEEVDRLSREGGLDQDAAVITQTLQAFTHQATAASDLLLSSYQDTGQETAIAELRDFTADSLTALEGVQERVPDGARAALIQAFQTLGAIDESALLACPTCSDGGLLQIPPFAVTAVAEVTGAATGPGKTPAGGREPKAAPGGKGRQPSGGGEGAGTGGAQLPTDLPAAGGRPPAPSGGSGGGTQDGGDTPAQGGGGTGSSDDGKTSGPIDTLTQGITGSGSKPPPSVPTQGPNLGEVVDGLVEGLTGPLAP